MDKAQELQSLKRGLKALSLINLLGSITIAELSRQLRLPRTTAERVLMTLLAEGYAERDPITKAFFLTSQVLGLSDGYAEVNQLVTIAKPIMLETTREIGWPLCLATPLGEHMSVRITTDPATSLNLNRRIVGSLATMALSSSGIVWLAFLDDTQRAITMEMLRHSDNPAQAGVHDTKRMDYLLDQTRSKGFSFGLDFGRERSVAVPVMVHGRIKAALLMVFMARVLTNDAVIETYVPRLKAIAANIEDACGPLPDNVL